MEKRKRTRKENIVKEIDLPKNVRVAFDGGFLIVKGPKGEPKKEVKQRNISVKVHDSKIIFESKSSTKESKKLLGSLVAHTKNMVKGSTQGHIYVLKICSGHFPMNVSVANGRLMVKNFLGEKVPRVLQLKQGVDVKVEGDTIYVTSPAKELAGQVSADIEQLTRRPGYDTRVFQDGCYIISKDGKELK